MTKAEYEETYKIAYNLIIGYFFIYINVLHTILEIHNNVYFILLFILNFDTINLPKGGYYAKIFR